MWSLLSILCTCATASPFEVLADWLSWLGGRLLQTLQDDAAHTQLLHPLYVVLLRSCRLDSTAAGALHDALLATPCLQLLSLQKAVLESNSSSTLPSLFSLALAAHPTLAKLELQQVTGLQQHGWQQLGAYVAQAPVLQELLLQEAQLGLDAAASFAAGLLLQQQGQLTQQPAPAPSPGLRVLDLSSCSLGPDAAAQLGTALGARCSKLAVLRLGQTELGPEGAAGLCAGLAAGGCCCRLELLDLSGNKLKGERLRSCVAGCRW